MHIKINDYLIYGNSDICHLANIHACKEPCHRQIVNYTGVLDKHHPYYLHYEVENKLYLNIVDSHRPLFFLDTFEIFLDFAEKIINSGDKVIIHCNEGRSRSPSLALLLMSKRLDLLPNDSYKSAYTKFMKYFPYNPSRGIYLFLNNYWDQIK